MKLTFKKSKPNMDGPIRRRPLLPDDRFLDAQITDVEIVDVTDNFNGGQKKMIKFSMALLDPKLRDPQDKDDHGNPLPRRVTYKVNLPKPGRGVHEKSKFYQFVVAALGRDPWAAGDDSEFDLESLIKSRCKIKVMMNTSEEQEREIEEADGSVVTVNDYQFQWVEKFRTFKGARTDEVLEETEEVSEEEAHELAKPAAKPAAKAAAKPAAKPVAKGKAKPAPEPEPEPEPEAEPEEAEAEAEEAEGEAEAEAEEAGVPEEVMNAFITGLKERSAKSEVAKTGVMQALKKCGITSTSQLKTASLELIQKIAGMLKIALPVVETEEESDDLSFLR